MITTKRYIISITKELSAGEIDCANTGTIINKITLLKLTTPATGASERNAIGTLIAAMPLVVK